MRKNALILATVLTIGIPLSYVSAKHHWKPLDPSTYWNPTVIDGADTANPGHYFYHDVEKQGGTVIDHTRAKHEEQKTAEMKVWKDILGRIFGLIKDETKHLSSSQTEKLEQKHKDVLEALKGTPIVRPKNDKSVDMVYEDTNIPIIKGKDSPRKWADESYKDLTMQLSKQIEVIEKLQDDLDAAVKELDAAESELQVKQANAHIETVKAEAQAHFAQYMSIRAQIKGINERTENAVRAINQNNVHPKNFIIDPLNNEADKAVVEEYEKLTGRKTYKPKGMPSFN